MIKTALEGDELGMIIAGYNSLVARIAYLEVGVLEKVFERLVSTGGNSLEVFGAYVGFLFVKKRSFFI
jgi:hypothetical protein